MRNRHSNALAIQDGACNPIAIANSIIEAFHEIRNAPDYRGTAHLTSDPAIRLMAHQLAYLCGVISGAEDFANTSEKDYGACLNACREATHEQA